MTIVILRMKKQKNEISRKQRKCSFIMDKEFSKHFTYYVTGNYSVKGQNNYSKIRK